MLSFLQSFFTTDKEPEVYSSVITVLRRQGLKYKETKGSVQVNIQDESDNTYMITIPLKFIGYIQIVKELKDKSGDCFNCVYVYKFNKDELVFVNRIKLINSLNPDMIIDDDDSRISNIHLLGIIEKLIKNIYEETANSNKKKNSIDLYVSNNSDDTVSISKSDVNDFNYIKYKSKYNNLKNIQDVTMLSTVSSIDSSSSVQSSINTSDAE